MTNGWTPARRARQATLIRRWKPWEKSSGPKNTEGKAMVARNPYKGAAREKMRELTRLLGAQLRSLQLLLRTE